MYLIHVIRKLENKYKAYLKSLFLFSNNLNIFYDKVVDNFSIFMYSILKQILSITDAIPFKDYIIYCVLGFQKFGYSIGKIQFSSLKDRHATYLNKETDNIENMKI